MEDEYAKYQNPKQILLSRLYCHNTVADRIIENSFTQ